MFHLRQIPKSVAVRCRLSSSLIKPLIGVSVDNQGIATVQIQRAPVNSLNLELLQTLRDSICEVEQEKCKGMVLTSESLTIFSAGLDLKEFLMPNTKRLILLKESLFDVVTKIFTTDLITTIAINGYAAAGACVLALACDYRTMTTGQATMGVNDTVVGIPPAKWIIDLMTRTIGLRHAEYALTSSLMFPAELALQVGLIDDVAADKTDAIEKCKAFIRTYDHISPVIRATTKRSIRQEYLRDFEKNRNQYLLDFVGLIASPTFQDTVDQYIQSMKQNKSVKNAVKVNIK